MRWASQTVSVARRYANAAAVVSASPRSTSSEWVRLATKVSAAKLADEMMSRFTSFTSDEELTVMWETVDDSVPGYILHKYEMMPGDPNCDKYVR